MGVNLIALPDNYYKRRLTSYIEDDFCFYSDGDQWTKLAADGGSSVAAGDSSYVVLTTGGTDNNEAMVKTTKKNFTITANKQIVGDFLIQYSEANTDDANIFVGFSSAAAANLMVDDGAGPATNMSAFGIFKVDGGTVWKVISSIGTSQTITTSGTTAGGSTAQHLRVECLPVSSTVCEVTFYVDGKPLYDASQTSRNVPIKHSFTYTGAAAMNGVAYVKAGGSNSEVLNLDYAFLAQVR